jgi:hypothetical protein
MNHTAQVTPPRFNYTQQAHRGSHFPTNFSPINKTESLRYELENMDLLNKSIILIDHVMRHMNGKSSIKLENNFEENNNDNLTSDLLTFLEQRLMNRRSDLDPDLGNKSPESDINLQLDKKPSGSSKEELQQSNTAKKKPKRHMPCVHGIHDFTSALLYSVETQHTIGYGLRYITVSFDFFILNTVKSKLLNLDL